MATSQLACLTLVIASSRQFAARTVDGQRIEGSDRPEDLERLAALANGLKAPAPEPDKILQTAAARLTAP